MVAGTGYPDRMARPRVLSTAPGTRPGAFGLAEWGLLASVALMWGSSFLWIAIGLETFRPGLITLARIALGAVAIGVLRRSRAPVRREDWPRIVLLAFVWTAIPLLLFPIAQDLGVSSSAAGMINGAVPLFSAVFATILLRRLPGPVQIGGLLIGFAGVVLISVAAAGGATGSALGAGLALLATVLYGVAANIIVPLQQRYGALPVIFRAQLVALVASLPLGVAALPGSRWSWGGALAMVALGVFGTGLAYIASSTLLGRAGSTRGAVQIYFIPIVALILGVVFRDETVAPVALVGIGLVLAGAWLTSRREGRVDARPAPPVEGPDP
jgi:drug/metabolite transporter (DMT)-like permease